MQSSRTKKAKQPKLLRKKKFQVRSSSSSSLAFSFSFTLKRRVVFHESCRAVLCKHHQKIPTNTILFLDWDLGYCTIFFSLDCNNKLKRKGSLLGGWTIPWLQSGQRGIWSGSATHPSRNTPRHLEVVRCRIWGGRTTPKAMGWSGHP